MTPSTPSHSRDGSSVAYVQPPATLDLPALDARILERWDRENVFAESVERTRGGEPWVFYEGPPTANGHPGTHHIEARAFKDVFPRFQTMRGRYVERRAGWDCHGLPVELAVEKELGFTGKGDIEAYGVAEFNAHCRESVLRHVDEFETLTRRIAFWVDMSKAYRTMDTSYVESVWWSLKQIFDSGRLVEDHRVAPYCPRCQTGLSDHEVAQGYTQLVDPSVYVRLPVVGPDGSDAGYDLLVWTTTPWTLVSNTAVAVHPDLTYARVRTDGRDVLVAQELVAAAVGEGAEVVGTFTGKELERKHYAAPFDLVDVPDAHYVVLADYVTTDEGTGLVHQAPAFGAEDMAVARAYGLPIVNPIRTDGTFREDVGIVGGQFFKKADEALVEDLRERQLLWRYRPYEHTYPLCWRCDTPLLYYALPSWYIRTTAVKDELLAENAKTDWHPQTIRDGRYGEWLRGNVDWALSRSRFWGTPLPLWRCEADPSHVTAVGSLKDLSELSGTDQSELDPHRPYVDDVTAPCPTCGATSRRVPEVIDAWYDSGSMPFAQLGYPHVPGSVEAFESNFPADMICEALDQTRGWFYTLMAVNTLVHGRSSYKSVLCLGLILDEHGRKMSKHLGNVLDPIELLDKQGADPVRWLMLCSGNPWQPRRVGHENVAEVTRTLLLTWWNTLSFFTTYANANGWSPSAEASTPGVLDRWVLSELAATRDEVTDALEAFDAPRAGRRLTQFVDDLSNWYVRRSRRRFWDGDDAALTTLLTCLSDLCLLMAPFTPFLAEEVWSVLHPEAESVHLQTWPAASAYDAGLAAEVETLRRLTELGRSARATSKVKTRQPLSRAVLSGPGVEALTADLLAELADELNVRSAAPAGATAAVTTTRFKPNFRGLGKRFGGDTKAWAAKIEAGSVEKTGPGAYLVDGETLGEAEVTEIEVAAEGLAVATEGAWSVALDLTLTPELVAAGQVRDAVRLMQDARKAAGLDVSDRIELWWEADGEVGDALAGDAGWPGEVLATSVTRGRPHVDLAPYTGPGLTFWLREAGA